jgi:hypothetical protein
MFLQHNRGCIELPLSLFLSLSLSIFSLFWYIYLPFQFNSYPFGLLFILFILYFPSSPNLLPNYRFTFHEFVIGQKTLEFKEWYTFLLLSRVFIKSFLITIIVKLYKNYINQAIRVLMNHSNVTIYTYISCAILYIW